MKPYYERAGITIYHGQNEDVLPMLGSGAAHAVVTDPPYGIGWGRASWADDPALYGAMMRRWIGEATRIIGNGPFFVWQAMPNAFRWHEWFPQPFRILASCKGFVQYRPTSVQWSWDPVIFWGELPATESVFRKDYHVQKLAPFGANRAKIDHPSPRPYEATVYVVSLAAVPCQTVLDPFMGSGTTIVAAKALGLSAIGIEIEERYCEIAANRLMQDVLPLEMC